MNDFFRLEIRAVRRSFGTMKTLRGMGMEVNLRP